VATESRERMSRMRRTIAARLTASWQEIPHVTGHYEADASALMRARAELAEAGGAPVPIEALLLRAVVPLLAEFPAFNAFVDGEEIVSYGSFDIAVAVDTPGGLLVPVVPAVETLGGAELAGRVRGLIERAAERKLMPDEMSGATFTVSNLGALGGGHAVSILPPKTSAFLSVGRARPTVRLGPEGPYELPMMPISVTVDHRLIDGGPVTRFAQRLVEQLQTMAPADYTTPFRASG
jgi:pyruvate dehydrogenase E2 component (dihydrolipoamide acetyltransferase)